MPTYDLVLICLKTTWLPSQSYLPWKFLEVQLVEPLQVMIAASYCTVYTYSSLSLQMYRLFYTLQLGSVYSAEQTNAG